jgi:hypothetical protein
MSKTPTTQQNNVEKEFLPFQKKINVEKDIYTDYPTSPGYNLKPKVDHVQV